MTLKTNRSAASLLLAAAIAAALVACAPSAPAPSTSPAPAASPAATPTASASAAAALSPQPIIDLTCAELLADSTVAAQFAVPVAPADAAISMMTASFFSISSAFVVRSLGGLACEWNNGESYSSSRGYNGAYVGYRVVVLPDATSQWAKYIAYYGPEGEGQYCNSISTGVLSCSSNDPVGDLWVEIETFGVTSEAAATALRDSVIDIVSAAAPVALVWVPPAGTLPLPTDCASLVPYSTVTSALGSSAPLEGFKGGGGGWSLRAGANVNAGVGGCGWFYPDSDYSFGNISTLAGAAWAWDQARPALTTPAVPEPLVIAGLTAADQAWIRCAPANAECVVDLVIGGNWIEFYLWPDEGLGFVTADRRAAATAIAEGVVATLRP